MNATLTTTTNSYPEWQAAIRAAQQIVSAERDDAQRERDEKIAERDKERGRNLMQALNLLGIQIDEPPAKDYIEIGGYLFWLKRPNSNSNGPVFNVGPSRTIGVKDTCIWFTLFVSKVAFPHDSKWDIRPKELTLIVTNGKGIDSDWTEKRAELADLLDQLDEHYAAEMHRYNVWLSSRPEVESKPAEPTPEATTEEKLVKALRSLIRDIILDEVGEPFRGDDDQY